MGLGSLLLLGVSLGVERIRLDSDTGAVEHGVVVVLLLLRESGRSVRQSARRVTESCNRQKQQQSLESAK